nr:piggyBac transposable element-derived protein 3-like [Leptinotarsa decemlineata]
MDNWSYFKRPLTALELMEEIENIDDDTKLPDAIVLFPPINANEGDTDEDSGDEENVGIDNLPAGQLNAEVEIRLNSGEEENVGNKDELDFPDENNGMENNDISQDNSYKRNDEFEENCPLSYFIRYKKKKAKSCNWVERDIKDNMTSWKNIQGPSNQLSSVELFSLFFDDEVWQMITDYTNLYSIQKNRPGDISLNEIKCFFGVLLLSGYHYFSRRSLYWESNDDAGSKLVTSAISRNRFNFIMQNIHCNDNTILNVSDKFSKIRPLVEALNKRFITFAPVQECHSIDETMVPYFGRHGSKQFIKGKPIRWGYKLWTGTTSKGYIEWFEPYQGSTTNLSERYKNLGLGASVILSFADALVSEKGCLTFHFFLIIFSHLSIF